MGVKITKYSFVPMENEQIDTTINLEEEVRSVIHGVVRDCRGKPVKDAVVKLLRAGGTDPCDLIPITHTFTDDCGQFLFGPLTPCKKYVIKVWYFDFHKCTEADDNHKCDDRQKDDDKHRDDDRHKDDDRYMDEDRHKDDDKCKGDDRNKYDERCKGDDKHRDDDRHKDDDKCNGDDRDKYDERHKDDSKHKYDDKYKYDDRPKHGEQRED